MGEGYKMPTLQRAKNRLGVRARKKSFGGGWEWILPEQKSRLTEDDEGSEELADTGR